MSSEDINVPEGLKSLIEEIAKKEGMDEYETKYKTMSTEGANYMGTLYLIDVKSANRELNLFSKVSNTPEKIRGAIKANETYEREIFVYKTLASTFCDLETKHSVPGEHRFNITKYYSSDLTDLEETIVLDNLIKKGYVLYDRFKSIDWNYAKAVIDQLAKFHALSYALKYEDPEKFEEYIKSKNNLYCYNETQEQDCLNDYLTSMYETAVAAIEDEDMKRAVKKFGENFKQFWNKLFVPDDYSVLAHVDFRASNIMVKYEEGIVESIVIVDYQTICYSSPINDLLYFLFAGSDQQFRKEHFDAYIQHYYESLARALRRLSLNIDDIYPKCIFDRHLKERLLFGLCLGINLLPIVLVQPEDAPTLEEILKTKIKVTKAYKERFIGIVEDMIMWGVLEV